MACPSAGARTGPGLAGNEVQVSPAARSAPRRLAGRSAASWPASPSAAAQLGPQGQPEGIYHSLRSTVAAGNRAAVQPGPAAIRLASIRVAGEARGTEAAGAA